MRFLHIGQPVNNGLFKKWVRGQRRDLEYNIPSWTTAFLEEFHRPGISLEKVVAFRAKYTRRMRQWKWEEHHFRYLSLCRMRLRRPLGAMRKQLSAMPDQLQRMAEWYRSKSSQYNRVPLVPCSGSRNAQRINERWDVCGITEGISGLQQVTLHMINEWRDAWGLTEDR